jgi:hypothetical protein
MAYLDLYCERVAPGLFAEPMNAATNAAFFLVAWLSWRYARRLGPPSADTLTLIALIAAVGVGSTLFHTFATPWARAFDEIPILLFQLLFLWVYARRVIGMPGWAAMGCIATFLAAALYGRQFPQLLNGSFVYVPALLLVLALGIYHWHQRKAGRLFLVGATLGLALAVFFRTLDAGICERFPLGTHFLWHVLVAAVIYLSMRALLAQRDEPGAPAQRVTVR